MMEGLPPPACPTQHTLTAFTASALVLNPKNAQADIDTPVRDLHCRSQGKLFR